MKKFILGLFTLTLIGATNLAMAGTNNEINIPVNNKEKSGVEDGKESNKYTFTLFSFFTNQEDNSKSDSLKTSSTAVEPKAKAKVN